MIFRDYSAKLRDSGIENAEGELTALIAFSAGISYDEALSIRLMSSPGSDCYYDVLGQDGRDLLSKLVERRISGQPLQYITGECFFYGRRFICRPGVLIPRFDTECVVECALQLISPGDKVLDLCCGSGCIGVTIKLECNAQVTCADVSDSALALTRLNAGAYCIDDLKTLKVDLFTDFPKGPFDMIVSNPPYIPSADIVSLSAEVSNEPVLALDGGIDGLDFYRRIIPASIFALSDPGYLVLECGIGQSDAVAHIMHESGFDCIKTKKDLSGISRVVSGRINGRAERDA